MPEVALRKELFRRGFRFRLHIRKLPGSPDIVLARYKLAIFVHGCFWHRHKGCKLATVPKIRTEFWQEKFKKNIERDEAILRELRGMGWNAAVVWQCEISRSTEATVDMLIDHFLIAKTRSLGSLNHKAE